MHEVAFNVMSKARCEVKIYPGPIESLNTCRKNPPGGISMQNEKFDDNLKTTVKWLDVRNIVHVSKTNDSLSMWLIMSKHLIQINHWT